MLRVAADDPLGAHPFGHKFGCSVKGGKKLLRLCRQLELLVIGVWYTLIIRVGCAVNYFLVINFYYSYMNNIIVLVA